VADQKSLRSAWFWGAGIGIVAVFGVVTVVVNQPKTAIPVSGIAPRLAPKVSSAAIEQYAALILDSQKTFFAAHKQYASRLEQLKLGPSSGVIVDYRGSSPMGFCWLVRTQGDVWYTVSQRHVNRTTQPITAPPPISCQ
jgi:hypothetical protein